MRIEIIGGGLTGAAAAGVLSGLPNVQFKTFYRFTSAPASGESKIISSGVVQNISSMMVAPSP